MGGGYAFVETVLRVKSVHNPDTCPGVIEPILSGIAPVFVKIVRGH